MRLCPACKTPMQVVSLEGEDIDVCTSCGGMFFEFDEMKVVLKNTLHEAFSEIYSGNGESDHSGEYICPKCGGNMQEEEYGFDSGIDIDRCGDCMSIFLNRGESLEINKYISSGASEEVQKVEEAKIDAEYENKWQKIVQEMYKKIKKDGLI